MKDIDSCMTVATVAKVSNVEGILFICHSRTPLTQLQDFTKMFLESGRILLLVSFGEIAKIGTLNAREILQVLATRRRF